MHKGDCCLADTLSPQVQSYSTRSTKKSALRDTCFPSTQALDFHKRRVHPAGNAVEQQQFDKEVMKMRQSKRYEKLERQLQKTVRGVTKQVFLGRGPVNRLQFGARVVNASVQKKLRMLSFDSEASLKPGLAFRSHALKRCGMLHMHC